DILITDQPGGGKTTSMSWDIRIFGDAIVSAGHLEIDIDPFRQNVVHYIPFAWGNELKAIFRLVPDISSMEMASVMQIYEKDTSDVSRYQPSSFVEAVEQYHVTGAVPLLCQFVQKSTYDTQTRIKALHVCESLAPDAALLNHVFQMYRSSSGADYALAEA